MAKKQKGKTAEAKATHHRHAVEAEAGVAGALGGAALGGIAGPPGAVAGAIVGGIVGAVAAGVANTTSSVDAAHELKLDGEIGVVGGDLGAPNLKHPPAKTGLYSAESTGEGSSSDSAPAEGPIPPPES